MAGLIALAFGLFFPLRDLVSHGFARFLVLRLVVQTTVLGLLLCMLLSARDGAWLFSLGFLVLALAAGRVGALSYRWAVSEAAWDPHYDPSDRSGLVRDAAVTIGLLVPLIGAAVEVFRGLFDK